MNCKSVLQQERRFQVFWALTQCRLVQSSTFERSFCLHFQGQAVHDAWAGLLKEMRSYETSMTIYQSPRRNTLEDLKLQHNHCENLKSHNNSLVGIEVTRLRDGCGQIPCRGNTFLSSKTALRPTRPPIQLASGVKRTGLKLTTHLHLPPRLRMCLA